MPHRLSRLALLTSAVVSMFEDEEVAESLAGMSDLAVADMLGPIVTAAYTHDPEAASELIATFVADIRAGERKRLGQ